MANHQCKRGWILFKNIERIIEGRFPKWSLLFVWEDFFGGGIVKEITEN